MSLPILLAVLGSALLHALWNALIKTGTSRLGATVILSLGELPIGLAVAIFCKAPTWEVMPWVIASGCTHFFYKFFLTYAYARGDLSRVYPLARGTAPLIVGIISAGFLAEPLTLVRNEFGVVVGMVHFLIPFAAFPLASAMRAVDERALLAARGMGAGRTRVFAQIFVPMTAPGILGAGLVVFVFALGFFVTPAILGGGRSVMAAELIYLRIFQSPNWGLGAAISVILMVAVGCLLAVMMRQARPAGPK